MKIVKGFLSIQAKVGNEVVRTKIIDPAKVYKGYQETVLAGNYAMDVQNESVKVLKVYHRNGKTYVIVEKETWGYRNGSAFHEREEIKIERG